ncbi:MAG: complex I NDUFA9 subunit family protein [Xanthomonadales bacterium]|nr:complex I NDUFA9 subunit family protein [Gammaproteobacteria bacterium]NNK05041.1 complex I NDUFA9 subunit family protein [Xanthomonadales bacterium]NNK98855.1 complex I NDUFA9 subunit family protein [Xanthomonadales bacterium]
MKIVLIGASGFLGRFILHALTVDQHQCVVLTRAGVRRSTLDMLPGVKLVQADVYDPEVLAEQFAGAGAVFSMAGILNESGGGGKGFHKVHVELVEGIVEACRKAGVSRLLHLSALNAGQGQSYYLKSKGEAEEILLAADDLDVTIFQPSVIFGRDDSFFNRFAAMLSIAPFMPLACPDARLQPVYAGDVADAMAASLEDPMTYGKRYELAGPKSYSLKELVEWTAKTTGKRRLIIGLPGPASAMMAATMNLVPGKPLSWDNYLSLKTDNVSDRDDFSYFGIEPRSIDLVVPYYLTGSSRQRRLQDIRRR